MEEEKGKKKKGIDIDWGQVLDSAEDDCDPLESVALPEPKTSTETADGIPKQAVVGDDQQRDDSYDNVPDYELDESIRRNKVTLEKMASKLRDKGEKLRLNLRRMEEELERRKRRRVETDTVMWVKPTQAKRVKTKGDGFRVEKSFGSILTLKLENVMSSSSDFKKSNEVRRESSLLSCNGQNTKNNGELLEKGGQKDRSSSRHLPPQCPINFYHERNSCSLSNGDHKDRDSSPSSRQDARENVSSYATRNDTSRVHGLILRPRKAQTIVVVDEEEPQPMDATEQAEELPECMKDTKIDYPSRIDPKSVEINYTDIKCLDPGAYLSSTIINFYIRYLQQQASPTDRAICDCHFFNTFFYKKLKDEVSYKGNDKAKHFGKFRRWWKGVNLFQKAYILIPINEDIHWSLVIICIPDKEEESGPILLHLDSLGVHCHKSIFRNIKSYLKEEWNYLHQDVTYSDPPISDNVWKNLPQKIEERKLLVPQQENDYDCGLFVLLFMERFIEEAPPRLKKNDLSRFGKRWFKPEEASSLRMKIRKLLMQKFRDAHQAKCFVEEASPSVGASSESIEKRNCI